MESILDGLEILFPFIERKKVDSFNKSEDGYVEAEHEWKKAQAENEEFVESILKVCFSKQNLLKGRLHGTQHSTFEISHSGL